MIYHSLTQLALLALTSPIAAQSLISSLSFGHETPLSSDGRALKNWQVSSVNHNPQLMSDRIIITPPVPGNARGALWSESRSSSSDWTAEFEFRASGQDGGTGNLQIWYVEEKSGINTNSLYTVEKFDGLALVIDQYGGSGGKIRGFLNDGTQNFRAHAQLESLAFGHCDYNYRNLGRPSKIKITSQNGLKVEVDGRECFRTDHVSLPSGNFFGVTSATGENPDSFEVNKFIVSTLSPPSDQQSQPVQQRRDQLQSDAPSLQKLDRFPGSPEAVPDRSADEIKNQVDQFADLHNRLQGLSHQIANVFGEFDTLARRIDTKHNELRTGFPQFPTDRLDTLNRRVEGIEQTIGKIQKDVSSQDSRQLLEGLRKDLARMQGVLPSSFPEMTEKLLHQAAPRLGWIVFALVGVQVALFGLYTLYKKRMDNAPKKYL